MAFPPAQRRASFLSPYLAILIHTNTARLAGTATARLGIMQLAIGVALFCLGYWAAITLASKPDKGRGDVVAFLDKVATFFSGIRIKTPVSSRQSSPVRAADAADKSSYIPSQSLPCPLHLAWN